MIVYRELASLTRDLSFSTRTLYSVSRRIDKHYRPASLPKKNGERRELQVPDRLLKAIQTRIYERLLSLEPVSPYATAYRPGCSVKRNALPHIGQPVLLKLDIRQFFDHAIYSLVKEKAFPSDRYSEQNRVLLAILCTFRNALPQGAPTSPAISNLILKDFDDAVGEWCRRRRIAYTRYCDDMTLSGDFDPKTVIALVSAELKKLGFFLNHGKTVVARDGRQQKVTGVVVNEKLSVPALYKRTLRQELYYCKKYGIASHLSRKGVSMPPERYRQALLGRVRYVLSVEPENAEFAAYLRFLKDAAQSSNE